MVQIDLSATIIPASAQVWRLFPGEHYKFLGPYLETKTAFLDIPGFVLPEGNIALANDLPTRLRRSEIVLAKIASDGRDTVPVVTDAELKDFRVGKKRQRHIQAVLNFYHHAAPGDLIVIPDRLSEGQVMIGRFAGRNRRATYTNVPKIYGETEIPARRVDWYGFFPENKLSTPLSRSLRNEYPFSLLEKSLFLEVFSLAFNSYVFGEHHSATIFNEKDDFLDLETALLGIVSRIAARVTEAVDKDDTENVDIWAALFEAASIEYHCSIASDVHSIGFNRFTASKITPLVIAAFIAALSVLGECHSKAEAEALRGTIEIVNSSAKPNDPCTADVSRTAHLMLDEMDMDKVWKLCHTMKDAERRAGLKSSAHVHHHHHPHADKKHG